MAKKLIMILIMLFKEIKNLFFPTMVMACEIMNGDDMIKAHSELKKAGISRYKVEMAFSKTPIKGLTPPVMQVLVPSKHLDTVKSIF
ncbi:hypothetical protein [Gracilibacillus sp. YIM 98692]|uniref:hypothetical protein n=1 Tax=Gracilibacillus sp. YIM 98692 TaxID=2663532 RepID=UPI0013D87480|nr:hypothetical protein [Gracilibacillus sp. YIM 98692]